MSLAKYPKPDELIKIQYAPPKTGWMETPVDFRPGTWSYSGAAKNLDVLGSAEPEGLAACRRRLETARQLAGHYLERHEGTSGKIPFLPTLYGHLRPLRRLCG